MVSLRLTALALALCALCAACGGGVSVRDEVAASAGSGGSGAFGSASSGPGGSTSASTGPDDRCAAVGGSGGVPGAGAGGGAGAYLCLRLVGGDRLQQVTMSGITEDQGQVPPGFAPAGLVAPPAMTVEKLVYDCSVGALTRNDLVTDAIEVSDVPCFAVAIQGARLVVANDAGTQLTQYESWDDVLAHNGQPMELPGYAFSRMGFGNDVVVFARQSSKEVDRYQLSSQSDLGPLVLDGFDGCVQGVDATDDGVVIVNSGALGDTLEVFDGQTGAKTLHLYEPASQGESTQGLTCYTVVSQRP
jgi:hypothetical protein